MPSANVIKPTYDLTLAQYALAVHIYPVPHRRIEELLILDDAIYQQDSGKQLARLLTAIDRAGASYDHYANFSIYNQVYHIRNDNDVCAKCGGAGGSAYSEYTGDPPMGCVVDYFEPCDDCIGAGLCPGCMQPLAYTFDYSAFGEDQPLTKRATGWYYPSNSGIRTIQMINPPIIRNDGYEGQAYGVYEYDAYTLTADEAAADICRDWFSCSVCGWRYDAERLNDYYDDSDYYPDDDPGFDPMFLM